MIKVFIPSLLFAASTIFFYWNFARGEKSSLWKVGIGFMAILLAFSQLAYWVIFDDQGVVAFIAAIYASFISFLSGLLFFLLPIRKGKSTGLWIGLLIPVLMFAAIWFLQDFSPTFILRKNGIILAAAIDQYKEDTGHYPQALQELIPMYTTDLMEPDDTWGWLYLSTGQDFTLGYVENVDKWGYRVCIIRATNREWDCLNNSDPFKLGPTPFPTLSPAQ